MHSVTVSQALSELDIVRKIVRRVENRQVRSLEDRDAVRATAQTWFHSHRPLVIGDSEPGLLAAVDEKYQLLLRSADRNTTKAVYLSTIKEAKALLADLRSQLVVVSVAADAAPDFAPLTPSDPEMRTILERRWIECTKCVGAKAHMAAIVMMGGLLEALFVARARLVDKSQLVNARTAPKEPSSGKTVAIDKWMLDNYLQVGLELGWIRRAAYDVGKVLGEFRNYVHPAKERRHGMKLEESDSQILWDVTKRLSAQLLSVK